MTLRSPVGWLEEVTNVDAVEVESESCIRESEIPRLRSSEQGTPPSEAAASASAESMESCELLSDSSSSTLSYSIAVFEKQMWTPSVDTI